MFAHAFRVVAYTQHNTKPPTASGMQMPTFTAMPPGCACARQNRIELTTAAGRKPHHLNIALKRKIRKTNSSQTGATTAAKNANPALAAGECSDKKTATASSG